VLTGMSLSRSLESWRGKTSRDVADMTGPSINHSATACHGTHLINPSLEPYNGKGPVTADRVSKQSTRRSRDPRLVESLHTTSIQHTTGNT